MAAITHREFKLLMKPEKFRTRRQVVEFNDLLLQLATKFGVRYDEFDSLDCGVRTVQFFDTDDEVFRKNHIILRLRADRSGWPDELYEVTFKCRTPDYSKAADFDVSTSATVDLPVKHKFKEELLRDQEPGSMRRIFSNNMVGQYPVVNFSLPMSRIIEIFPGLKTLQLDPSKQVSAVNGVRIFELEAKLGTFYFGKDVVGEATIAIWTRPETDKFDVLIGEFGYSYHAVADPKKAQKGYDVSDAFFKDLQIPLADYFAPGTTKTALVYGTPE